MPGPAGPRQKHVGQGQSGYPAPQTLDECPSGDTHFLPPFGELRIVQENCPGRMIACVLTSSPPWHLQLPPQGTPTLEILYKE